MNNSGLARVSAIDTASMQDFLEKCKVVGDQLEFVLRAVDVVVGVCSFPSKYQF